MAKPATKCQCDTNDYYLKDQPDADRKVIADSLRRLAEDVQAGQVKQISWHVAYVK